MIPKMPAPAEAGVDTGFRKRSCSTNNVARYFFAFSSSFAVHEISIV
jgi:hypothetical protein